MFKNMKIEINEQQPLDEVVKELKRLGYKEDYVSDSPVRIIITWGFMGIYDLQDMEDEKMPSHTSYITLAELKDMPLNDFGFDFKQQPSNTVELGMQMLEEGVENV